ncbi:uncharacterized protein LOC119464056 [Dermacentor silvarum]|uniref:uncharacterized protein LOC119464056 n=1 Tax=Dermacentor silvarum TaxID=543639 RepID=UPI002101054F|nr:uncharacterized protein LOC119464056 [Dermacentor silvarum]
MVAVQGSVRESTLAGFAFVGSACTPTREQLGEDTAHTYRGIRIMTHEMAHTLGCSHDGTAVDGHLKGYKADSMNCPWQDGYLMSYIEEDSRSMRFSSCCDYDMSRYSWSRDQERIRAAPREGRSRYQPSRRGALGEEATNERARTGGMR